MRKYLPSFIAFGRLLFLLFAIVCWFSGPAAFANDPGGGTAGSGANVTISGTSSSSSTVTLSNGVISATIQKSTGKVTSYTFNGTQMLDTSGQIYYSMDGGTSYENPHGCVYSATVNTTDMIDISLKQTYASTGYIHAVDIDLHYVLRRGDTGLYAYAILNHDASYPATTVGEWRIVWKLPHDSTNFFFERAYVDDLRNWQMESYYDFTHGIVQGIAEVLLLTTGLRSGKYDCKYEYAAAYQEIGCWGHASDTNKKGVWMVLGGYDYLNDGPQKQDLDLAESYSLIHFGRNHFGGSGTSIAAGEAWKKMFGPYLLYCNSTTATSNAGDALWADARAQVQAEIAAWPYSWLTGNSEYPTSSGRGTVTGRFLVSDPLKPALTGSNAWIGLAPPGVDWQYDSKNYQYWIKADGTGNFSIPAVRPGTYTLHAYVDGAVDEYSQTDVTVTANQTTALGNVTWNVPHSGVIAWEIGVPNRSASEFRHGHKVTPEPAGDFYYYEPYLWTNFVNEWTNPLVYNVGTSDWATDWNYAQSIWNVNGTKSAWRWSVNFNLASVPLTRNATLTIAFAGSDASHLYIYVNNESQSFADFYPPNSGGNNLLREGIHGKYGLTYVTIPVSRLRVGANTISFVQGRTDSDGNNIMYDYISLEMPLSVPLPPGRDIVWKGGLSSNAWDLATTANWLVGGTATAFATGDRPVFNDSTTNTMVSLSGTLAPGMVTVSSDTRAYTFNSSGSLVGPMTLIKSGSATLTVSGSNDYSGGTIISSGTLVVGNDNALGTSTVSLDDATLNLGPRSLNQYLTVSGSSRLLSGDGGGKSAINGLNGSGLLNVVISSGNVDLRGDISLFSGTLLAGSGGNFRFNGSGGSSSTAFNLGSNGSTSSRTGATALSLGSLTGGPGATLGGPSNYTVNLIYSIGGNDQSTTFQGRIVNGGQAGSTTGINKVGNGTLTLAGSSSYTGATTVSAGTLLVNGTLNNSGANVTVLPDAALGGSGRIAGSVAVQSGGTMVLGSGTGAGTLTIGGSLALTDATVVYNLSNSTTAGGGINDLLALTGGSLSLNGVITIQPNYLNGVLASGTYTLISGGTATTNTATFAWTGTTGQTVTFDTSQPGTVLMIVSRALKWTGVNLTSGTSPWDYSTPNWLVASGTTTFGGGDDVIFDDSGTNTSVTIPGAVTPGSVTVSNAAKSYAMTGTAGRITGSATLIKSGTGTLTLNGSNSYSGGTIINGGNLILNSSMATGQTGIGSGPILMTGGTLTMNGHTGANGTPGYGAMANSVEISSGATVGLNLTQRGDFSGALTGDGILNLKVNYVRGNLTGDWSGFTGQIVVTSGSGTSDFRVNNTAEYANAAINLGPNVKAYSLKGGTLDVGELSGSSSALIVTNSGSSGGLTTTWSVGSLNTDATYSGTISESTSITKVGSGTWTLGGTCSYTGSTSVLAGTLCITGSLTNTSALEVADGATLCLQNGGVKVGNVHVASGGGISGWGRIVGNLTNDGTVACGNGGSLSVTGTVTNNGTMLFTGGTLLSATGSFVNNGVLDIMTSSQPLPPHFVNNGVVLDSSAVKSPQATKNGTNFSVTIQSYVGHGYQLQCRASLASGSWVNIGASQPGTNGVITLYDAGGATGGQKFYRVLVSP